MAAFESFNHGRFFIHTLATKQFKTRHVIVKLSRPVTRENLTATAVLPYLWMEGTSQYPSAQSIMRYADDLFGAVVRSGIGKRADRHLVEAFATVPEETGIANATGLFKKAVDLVLDLITDPLTENNAFPGAHVEREKALHRKRIESIFDDKIAYAMERCMEEVCKGDPVGLPRLGYLEDMDELSGESLWNTYQQLLNDADIHVYVIGNIGNTQHVADGIVHTLTQRLAARGHAVHSAQTPVTPLPRLDRASPQYVVDRQEIQQGKLNLGFRTDVSYRSDQFPALMICNGVLGAFPHSKLFVNVREKASLAYYASSRLDSLTGILSIQTGIEVENYEQALDIIIKQVQAIKDGHVDEEELSFTIRGFRNQYLQLADQPGTMTDVHFNGVLAGIHREIPDLLAEIEAVTAKDVIDVAQSISLDTVYFLKSKEVKNDA